MKILIIEDEKELAQSMVEYLSAENYLCELALTFKEAMNKVEKSFGVGNETGEGGE